MPAQAVNRLVTGLLLALLALGCAAPPRPLTDADRIAGARALDTSFRVKDRVTMPGPYGAEYVLPIGEYRPARIDEEGIFYAAPQGILERAGFSKRLVAGGIFVPNTAVRPWDHPMIYVDRDDGRTAKIPITPSFASGDRGVLRFAVDGEEQEP